MRLPQPLRRCRVQLIALRQSGLSARIGSALGDTPAQESRPRAVHQRPPLRRCCCSRLLAAAGRHRCASSRRRWPRALRPTPTLQPQAPGLTLHLPFCRRRCYYCDFVVVMATPSTMIVSRTTSHCSSGNYQSNHDFKPLATVYPRGGTPLVEPRSSRNCSMIEKHGICRGAEITLECDPGTFDERNPRLRRRRHYACLVAGPSTMKRWRRGRAHRRCDALDAVSSEACWSFIWLESRSDLGLPGTTPGVEGR